MIVEDSDRDLLIQVFYDAMVKHELDMIRWKYDGGDNEAANHCARKYIYAYKDLLEKLKLSEQ